MRHFVEEHLGYLLHSLDIEASMESVRAILLPLEHWWRKTTKNRGVFKVHSWCCRVILYLHNAENRSSLPITVLEIFEKWWSPSFFGQTVVLLREIEKSI